MNLHAGAARTMAGDKAISAESDQPGGTRPLQQAEIDPIAQSHYSGDDGGDRESMAQSDRHERPEYLRATLMLKTETDGEQPAHRRVEAVEGSETDQREPHPRVRHGRLSLEYRVSYG